MRQILYVIIIAIFFICSVKNAQSDIINKQLHEVTNGFSDYSINGSAQLQNLIAFLSQEFNVKCKWENINSEKGILHILGEKKNIKYKIHYQFVFIKNINRNCLELSSVYYNGRQENSIAKEHYLRFVYNSSYYDPSKAKITTYQNKNLSDDELRDITNGFSDLYIDFRQDDGTDYKYTIQLKNLIAYFSQEFELDCLWENLSTDKGNLHLVGEILDKDQKTKNIHYQFNFIKNNDRACIIKIFFNDKEELGLGKKAYMKVFAKGADYNPKDARVVIYSCEYPEIMSDEQLQKITGGFSDLYISSDTDSSHLYSGYYNKNFYSFNVKLKHLFYCFQNMQFIECQWEKIDSNKGILHLLGENSKIHHKLVFKKISPTNAVLIDVYENNKKITPFAFDNLNYIYDMFGVSMRVPEHPTRITPYGIKSARGATVLSHYFIKKRK